MQAMRTYKYRVYPSKQQEKKLLSQLRIACNIYNQLLEKKKTEYEKSGKSLSEFDLNNYIAKWKQQNQELKQIHSQILQQQSRKITNAFKNFFRRLKNGEKPGFPRFKSLHRFNSLIFPQSGFAIESKKLFVSKVGLVNIRLHRKIKGETLTMTIKRTQSGKWFACFVCKLELITNQPTSKKYVGVDLGLTHFATLSDGAKIENPMFLAKTEAKLRSTQRKMSKKKKESKNRCRQKLKLAKLFEKLTNQRTDFSHKISNWFIKNFSLIALEDLNVQLMSKKSKMHLSKHISDASWSNFISMLCYKAEEAGSKVVLVNPKNTTKICSNCGTIIEKTLSERMHRCNCGLQIDRDYNAAINILNRAYASKEDRPGTGRINACGDVSIETLKKQEAHQLIGE